jgi:hypothetical protein
MIILINANQQSKPIALHIGTLFNGQQDLQAAQIAINEINLQYHDLFNGRYILTLLSNNSRVCEGHLLEIINDNDLLFSVIQFTLLMLSFIRYSVVLKYCFLLVHHAQMKQKLLYK